jgi:hypothetical protein
MSTVHPSDLTWLQVDPGRHGFDPGQVAETVQRLALTGQVPPLHPSGVALTSEERRREAYTWEDAMTAALCRRYGDWAAGWRWSTHFGGVVESWCCTRYSVSTPEATLAAVTGSLSEWRSWLEDLAERFSRFLPVPADATEADQVELFERATAQLVTLTVDRTFHEGGWHLTCATVLTWFLEAAGIPPARRTAMIEGAIGGRFTSWTEPRRLLIDDVAERLAVAVTAGRHA